MVRNPLPTFTVRVLVTGPYWPKPLKVAVIVQLPATDGDHVTVHVPLTGVQVEGVTLAATLFGPVAVKEMVPPPMLDGERVATRFTVSPGFGVVGVSLRVSVSVNPVTISVFESVADPVDPLQVAVTCQIPARFTGNA